ncbi:MAG: hypothetical protein IT434_07090 [Phycisphaerales bacterium]|nr:hypothetical protein [Phycisphaerales bacterium]
MLLLALLAPASLATGQIIITERHEHMRSFQSAVLWDVNNDGKKELVIGGSHEVSAAVYDPDHISDGPLAMSFSFISSAFGAAATPSGRLFKVGQSPIISLYNSFLSAAANLDNGTSTGLAFFEGTPWGDVAIVSGMRGETPYLVGQVWGGQNHDSELFAVPVDIAGNHTLPNDLFGSLEAGEYILDMPVGGDFCRVSLGTRLDAPVQTLIWKKTIDGIGLTGGGASGIVRIGSRYFGTSIDEAFAGHLACPGDVDQNGFVNGDDYDSFASAFDVADPDADFNADGFVNGDDYDAFAEHFDAGC